MGWNGIGIGWPNATSSGIPPVVGKTINIQIEVGSADGYWSVYNTVTGDFRQGTSSANITYIIPFGSTINLNGSANTGGSFNNVAISSVYYGLLASDERENSEAAAGYAYSVPNVDDQITININSF